MHPLEPVMKPMSIRNAPFRPLPFGGLSSATVPAIALLAAAWLGPALLPAAAWAASTSDDSTRPGASPTADTSPASSDGERAMALLDRAAARLKENRTAALGDFDRNPAYVDKELYVFVLSQQGTMLASGGSSAPLIGRNMGHQTDARGKFFFRELLDKAEQAPTGSVQYWWLNQTTNRVEQKTSFYRRVGTDIVCVGYYNEQ